MAQDESSNSVAIVAIIVIGLLIAGAAVLYFNGSIGNRTIIQHDTVVEQPAAPAPAEPQKGEEPKPQDPSGFSFEHQDENGNKTEIHTPPAE